MPETHNSRSSPLVIIAIGSVTRAPDRRHLLHRRVAGAVHQRAALLDALTLVGDQAP